MANYRATATGNWSNLAIWQDDSSGSYIASTVLPGASDNVNAQGQTITLDLVTISAASFTNVLGGFFQYGSACITVIGNCANTGTAGGVVRNGQAGTRYFIGDSQAGSSGQVHGLANTGGGTLIQTGNATGGSGALFNTNAQGGSANASSGILIINGNAFGNGGGNCGAVNFLTGNITINGSTNNSAGIGLLGTGICYVHTVNGSSVSSNGAIVEVDVHNPSISTLRYKTTSIYNSFLTNGTAIAFAVPGINDPAITDVRQGVTYASGLLTGTLKVPPSSSVAVGVPVDNTTGTAILTVTDMGALLTSFKIS